LACLLAGASDGAGRAGTCLMKSPSTDCALIRTVRLVIVCTPGFLMARNTSPTKPERGLGRRVPRGWESEPVCDIRSPRRARTTGSLSIWPPSPSPFQPVDGIPAEAWPASERRARGSQGVKSASPTTSSPVPEGWFGTFERPCRRNPTSCTPALTVPMWLSGSNRQASKGEARGADDADVVLVDSRQPKTWRRKEKAQPDCVAGRPSRGRCSGCSAGCLLSKIRMAGRCRQNVLFVDAVNRGRAGHVSV